MLNVFELKKAKGALWRVFYRNVVLKSLKVFKSPGRHDIILAQLSLEPMIKAHEIFELEANLKHRIYSLLCDRMIVVEWGSA